MFLHGHEFADTALLLLFGDIVGEAVGGGALLGRVGEASHAVETGLTHKLFQLLEFLEGLARIADDEGGADGHVGQLAAEGVDEAQGAFAVDAALHGTEDAGVDVLEWDVDVVADIGVAAHDLDGVDGEGGGVGVVETNPLGTALGGEAFEQLAEHTFAVEVESVVGGVLTDD